MLNLDTPKEILDLKFMESNNEFVDQKYLKHEYELGKYVVKNYLKERNGDVK